MFRLSFLFVTFFLSISSAQTESAVPVTTYDTVTVDGLDLFYREAGSENAPTLLLLHGFPTSSHMFRDLIPRLASDYHVIAPDYPGFGYSSMPTLDEYDYSFANLADVMDSFTQALGLESYSLYVMDYGAPVGFRLALEHPERVESLIVQNGNAYDEGLLEFWDPIKAYWAERNGKTEAPLRDILTLEGTQWQYTHGTRNPEGVSPDTWTLDYARMTRPGNKDIQLQLFYDYRTNVPLYPEFQAYFREYQPPTLIVWGEHDFIFPAEGAAPYIRDLENVETHLLDTGHFALEEEVEPIASLMLDFLSHNVQR